MHAIENPPSFVVQVECDKAAFDNGFRKEQEWRDGWRPYQSTTARGTIHLAGAGRDGPWFLAVDHPGIVAELPWQPADMPGPGHARYAFDTTTELHEAVTRVYQLGVSLPDTPLEQFRERTRTMPRSTEAERRVIQRVGQNIFRESLMEYWAGRCPLTGIAEPALLRASHIRPWAQCETDEQRLDVHNGLLLSALWDAAFDAGLVSFDDEGRPVFSPVLGEGTQEHLPWQQPLTLTDAHRACLRWHREHIFREE